MSRRKNVELSIHHRKPTSIGGGNDERNLSEIPRRKHEAWHILFFNASPELIAWIINKHYLDPDYEMVVRKRNENHL